MGLDVRRMTAAAVDAALQDEDSDRRRGSSLRAVAVGVALGAAARIAIARAGDRGALRVAELSHRVKEAPDELRDRLADLRERIVGEEPADEELDEEEPANEAEPDEEAPEQEPPDEAPPEDEEEEPSAAEQRSEAEAEDQEPEDQGDEDQEQDSRGETPDVIGLLSTEPRRRNRVTPTSRPPVPPDGEPRRRSRKSASAKAG